MSGKCPHGVNLIGDLSADSGLGEAARALVRAIREQEIKVSHINLKYDFPRIVQGMVDYSLETGSRYPVNLVLYNLREFHNLSLKTRFDLCGKKYTIGHWVWELPKLPFPWQTSFHKVDEIWTPSQYCYRIMNLVNDTSVFVIPHPVEVLTSSHPTREYFHLPPNRFIFLFTFSATSSVSRKNPWGVLEAFKRAFPNNDNEGPLLVIKAHHLDMYPNLQQALRKAVSRVHGILIELSYTREETNDLLACADAYISLHRAEGFGLGIAEAMCLGKPVIATGYSSNTDFMNTSNGYLVDYTLRAITPNDHFYQPEFLSLYEPGQQWAEPDIDQAANYMRHLFSNPEEGHKRGRQAQGDIQNYCSPPVVGRLVKERLLQIEEKINSGEALHDRVKKLQQHTLKAYAELEAIRLREHQISLSHTPIIGFFVRTLIRMRTLGLLAAKQSELYEGLLEEIQFLSPNISHDSDII